MNCSRTWILVIIPHIIYASGAKLEISHAVLSKGQPVLAAVEGMLRATPHNSTVTTLSRKSGHFKPSINSLDIGVQAFEYRGINVLRTDYSH